MSCLHLLISTVPNQNPFFVGENFRRNRNFYQIPPPMRGFGSSKSKFPIEIILECYSNRIFFIKDLDFQSFISIGIPPCRYPDGNFRKILKKSGDLSIFQIDINLKSPFFNFFYINQNFVHFYFNYFLINLY